MSLWNNEEVAIALNTEIKFQFDAERVVIDSRKVKEGDLFVAIKGENFDGNEYASQAIKDGAVAAIISDEKFTAGKTILAKDGIFALERLAYNRRKKSNAKIIGVTGSVGKTTVKELLASIFVDYYSVHKTEGNLNNHIGLPLSMSNMPLDTKIGIFEMGMSGPNEISHLSRIAHPDIAVVTNVGLAHIEFFESGYKNGQEGIARAKAEIFDWLKVGGVAVIPADTQYFKLIEEIAESSGVTDIRSFGAKINNPIKSDSGDISIHVILERYNISEKVCREFNLNNILASLTIAGEIGVDIDDAIEAISNLKPFEGRGNKFNHSCGATIINDAYNASPESMVNALVKLSSEKIKGKKFAVLGDMLELGEDSKKYHVGLDEYLDDIDVVYVAGENQKSLSEINKKVQYFDNVEEIQNELEKQLNDGDVCLIKGSNGSKMWKVVEHLQKN